MKQFLITMAGVFAGLVIFVVAVPVLLVMMAASAARPEPLPAQAVLELDLRDGLTDQDAQNPLVSIGRRSMSVMSVIESLKHAESDGRVKGVLVRLPETGMAPAAADELREALKRFRAAGKPVFAHSQGIYPAGVVTSTYMLGAAADELWMQPAASLQVTGLAAEDVFFKRAFDKYGVEVNFQQRQEYKNAVNPYLYSDYTPEHREAQLSWMGSVYRSALVSAATDRKTDPAALQKALEAGPYLAEEAQRLGLVDKVGQVKEAEKALLAKAGSGAKLVEFEDYLRHDRRRSETGQAIAVIEAEGPIVTGDDGVANPLSGGSTIYADQVAEAIYAAAEDNDVKAIVMRVSSPGGSDTASEQIAAAVRAAKAAGKPVVVSMGTYAASGGYWISAEASSIVAQPTTLTGSIGVYGGKLALGPALERFGVDLRQTSVGGPYADAYSLGQSFGPEDEAAFSRWMDQIYENFVTRVATGRKLPVERVREIARGRVWTGAQARDLGLVDEVGGFYQAVEKAKALAGLKGEVRLKRMTPAPTPIEALERLLGVSAASARTLAAAAWLLGDPRAEAVLDEVARARMSQGRALVMSPTPVR
ncbi:MAG: signal peptide peptidase SppA [Phenylobacterium sp.]|jgi:protease-4|uniref:signal peptide peptidase SppA n=1 Tax=Phenylobacterium sp. TaxID=1871053 RepID=UPI002A36C075|nr:signal peptide peptidase SppA [Phenylobacterium sp.]MDX9997061.1 signal peptide peptidase SppA [Phenylobacterium sp.]